MRETFVLGAQFAHDDDESKSEAEGKLGQGQRPGVAHGISLV